MASPRSCPGKAPFRHAHCTVLPPRSVTAARTENGPGFRPRGASDWATPSSRSTTRRAPSRSPARTGACTSSSTASSTTSPAYARPLNARATASAPGQTARSRCTSTKTWAPIAWNISAGSSPSSSGMRRPAAFSRRATVSGSNRSSTVNTRVRCTWLPRRRRCSRRACRSRGTPARSTTRSTHVPMKGDRSSGAFPRCRLVISSWPATVPCVWNATGTCPRPRGAAADSDCGPGTALPPHLEWRTASNGPGS